MFPAFLLHNGVRRRGGLAEHEGTSRHSCNVRSTEIEKMEEKKRHRDKTDYNRDEGRKETGIH